MFRFDNALPGFIKWIQNGVLTSLLLAPGISATAAAPSAIETSPTDLHASDQNDSDSDVALAQLASLVARGDYEAAFALAQQLAPNSAGEPDFDWLYGRSALEAGRYSEARFIFERLLLLAPMQPRYRLEYARTLAALGEVDAARSAFAAVLAQNPPAGVQTRVEAAIAQLDDYQHQRAQAWQALISVGGGHDSNISSATTEQQIGLFELPANARERSSAMWSLRTGLIGQHRISERRAIGVDARSYHKHNTETSAYNLDSALLRPFYRWQQSTAQQELALLQQWVWLDGQLYQEDTGLDLRWLQQFATGWASVAQLGLVRRDHALADQYDSWQLRLNLAALLPPNQRGQHRVGLQALDETERGAGAAANLKTLLECYWTGAWQATTATRIQARLSAYQSHYHGRHPVFGETREDTGWRAAIGWEWQLASRWTFQTETSFTAQDSNLALYDYERALAELRLQWSL